MSRTLALASGLCFACPVGTLRADEAAIKNLSAVAEASIRRALYMPTTFEFDNQPLSDVVDFLAAKHEIDIVLDSKGLTDAAVDRSAPVTKTIRKPIPLRSALRLLLEEFDLTYTIQDDVLKITSKEKADEILTTKVYPVGDLLGGDPKRPLTMTDLIEAIFTTIQPDSWDDNGGPGSILPIRQSLLVSQKMDCHEEIADLLKLLRSDLPSEPKPAGENDTSTVTPPPAEYRVVVYTLQRLSTEETIKAVMTLVAPGTWQGQGGEGTACAVNVLPQQAQPNAPQQDPPRYLVVRQTPEVHVEVRRLLQKLDLRSFMGGMGSGMFNITGRAGASD